MEGDFPESTDLLELDGDGGRHGLGVASGFLQASGGGDGHSQAAMASAFGLAEEPQLAVGNRQGLLQAMEEGDTLAVPQQGHAGGG